eukprot:834234-Prymnesium_polylepis.1
MLVPLAVCAAAWVKLPCSWGWCKDAACCATRRADCDCADGECRRVLLCPPPQPSEAAAAALPELRGDDDGVRCLRGRR